MIQSDYQYAARLAKTVVFANMTLSKRMHHDLFEKDPKKRYLNRDVHYSLTLHNSICSHNDDLMELIMSPYGPSMFTIETREMLAFDPKKHNWQFLRIKDKEALQRIVSRYKFENL